MGRSQILTYDKKKLCYVRRLRSRGVRGLTKREEEISEAWGPPKNCKRYLMAEERQYWHGAGGGKNKGTPARGRRPNEHGEASLLFTGELREKADPSGEFLSRKRNQASEETEGRKKRDSVEPNGGTLCGGELIHAQRLPRDARSDLKDSREGLPESHPFLGKWTDGKDEASRRLVLSKGNASGSLVNGGERRDVEKE